MYCQIHCIREQIRKQWRVCDYRILRVLPPRYLDSFMDNQVSLNPITSSQQQQTQALEVSGLYERYLRNQSQLSSIFWPWLEHPTKFPSTYQLITTFSSKIPTFCSSEWHLNPATSPAFGFTPSSWNSMTRLPEPSVSRLSRITAASWVFGSRWYRTSIMEVRSILPLDSSNLSRGLKTLLSMYSIWSFFCRNSSWPRSQWLTISTAYEFFRCPLRASWCRPYPITHTKSRDYGPSLRWDNASRYAEERTIIRSKFSPASSWILKDVPRFLALFMSDNFSADVKTDAGIIMGFRSAAGSRRTSCRFWQKEIGRSG